MQQYRQPTNKEVRDWLNELVVSRRPPPEPATIREQLWSLERDRRQVLA